MPQMLTLLELNEINFDLVVSYIESGEKLPGFEALLATGLIETDSECRYEHLEPWIQWPSAHTGLEFAEHQVFRLGDIVKSDAPQLFERLEDAGYSVGAVSPMNAENRLDSPAYYIPDPWTETACDESLFSKFLNSALKQTVNDNASSRITLTSGVQLALCFARFVRLSRYWNFFWLALTSTRKSWNRAIFLDLLLYEVHRRLSHEKKPDFTVLFLNAGAHIQHHYFLNSEFAGNGKKSNPGWYVDPRHDPILDMLKAYDRLLEESISDPRALIVATGLSQVPHTKPTYYYRLNDHGAFLRLIEVRFAKVIPRMTRDFLVKFDSEDSAKLASAQLGSIKIDGNSPMFGEIEQRGSELFVVLTYPHEIGDETSFTLGGQKIALKSHVAFVAIKNGEHSARGFAFFSGEVSEYAFESGSHISSLHDSVLSYYGLRSGSTG